MKTNQVLSLFAGSVALVSAFGSTPAQAQLSANTTVGVDAQMPGVLFLRTLDAVDLEITADELNANGAEDSETVTAMSGDSPFETSVEKTINDFMNVWTTDKDGFSVTITTPNTGDNTLTHSNNTDTITITEVTNTLSEKTATTGLVNAATGSATFILDLTSAKTEGNYTGGTVTVTASTP